MPGRGKYKRVPQVLTDEDKLFIKLVSRGGNRSKMFRQSYPEHPTVVKYMDIVKEQRSDPEERKKLSQSITQLAKDKLQTKKVQEAMTVYNKKMEEFSDKSVDTAIDLVTNARSEKVRADLAIEGMRHRVGTPVQKVQVQQEQNIVISFGERHPDDVIDLDDIEEADTID